MKHMPDQAPTHTRPVPLQILPFHQTTRPVIPSLSLSSCGKWAKIGHYLIQYGSKVAPSYRGESSGISEKTLCSTFLNSHGLAISVSPSFQCVPFSSRWEIVEWIKSTLYVCIFGMAKKNQTTLP